MDVEDALRTHERRLMALPNVTGVGIGERDGRRVIRVFMTGPAGRSPAGPPIPSTLEGHPVEVVWTGPIDIQPR